MQRLRKILQHIRTHARRRLGLGIVLGVVALGLPIAANAQIVDTLQNGLLQVLGSLFLFVTNILGNLLLLFIEILIWIAQYNDFLNTPAVNTGWAVTRDLSNMFFIIALLLVSIGTVFRIQEYRYASMLRKLILMAILINFSKTIAGFFIDLSQVVTLTFVNAFKDLAAGNLTQGFGIDKIVTFAQSANAATGDIDLLTVLGSLFGAVVMLFVALVVVFIFVIYFAQRIVMLWIYIILAPTAYMVAVLPGTLGSWWGTWWRDFMQYLVRGPVIAFFLWLALTVISLSNNTLLNSNQPLNANGANLGEKSTFPSEATSPSNVINYIVTLGLLIAGLQQATKVSGATGNVASRWLGNLNRWGSAAANVPTDILKASGRAGLRTAGDVARRPLNALTEGLLNAGSKIPLVGGAFQGARVKFRQQNLRQEDKEGTFAKFENLNELVAGATGIAVTASAASKRKIRRERIIKEGMLGKLSEKQRENVLKGYENDIRMKVTSGPNDDLAFSAEDNDGLKVLKDAYKKNPAMLSAKYKKEKELAQSSSNPEERTRAAERAAFWEEQMKSSVAEMKVGDFADMSSAAWKDDTFAQIALANIDTRNKKFREKMETDVPSDVNEAIKEARARVNMPQKDEELAMEDINRQRQQRTETLQKQHGDAFEASAEYQANPSNFYSKQQYQQNARQQQRVMERLAAGKAGVAEVTSLNQFSRGTSNTLAVSEALLNQAGVKATAGGYTRNPESIKRIAGAFNQQLQGDVNAIEAELATLATEEKQLTSSSSKLVDASGRPMTQAQIEPQKLQDIATRRTALQARQATLQATQARLQNPGGLKDLTFINADRSGGAARNILAEEAMHKYIDEIDDDGSIRASMKAQFTPEEFQKIVADMRKRSDNAEMSDDRAFDEYLAKGLVNQGRWADTSKDAVQLKSGIPFQLKTLAEQRGKTGVDFKLATDIQPEAGEGATQNPASAKSESTPAANRTTAKQATTRRQPSSAALNTQEDGVTNVTNITNVTQNIQQAFKAAPQEIRGKLQGITPDVLDSALKNSIVWRGLMSYIKNNTAEIQKSEKLDDLGRTEIQKRIGTMEKHLRDGNAEEFKSEFGSLQRIFSSGSEDNS